MHMNYDPLVDSELRLLSFSANTPTQLVVDRILRLGNAKEGQKPIKIYISPTENGLSIPILDFLQIHAALKSIRSPVHTVALGTLRGYEVLLLAAGAKGHREILENSMLPIEAFRYDGLPFTVTAVDPSQGKSLHEQAIELFRAELAVVLTNLQVDVTFFQVPQVISPKQAIALGIADRVVPLPRP